MKKILISICLIVFVFPTMALADGKGDFNRNCGKCHGGSISTNARRAIMLKINTTKMYLPYSQLNKEEMTAIIEKGKDKMPGFKNKLSEEQITALVEYVLSLKKK